MAKSKALVDTTVQNKSLSWCGGLSGCLENSVVIVNSTKRRLKDSNLPESSSGEDDLGAHEAFEMLANRILLFLNLVSSQEEDWPRKLADGLVSSATLIGSLSKNSKTVYDTLKSIKFEDIAKTTESICTTLAKTHWAAGGLLVIAAILHNIQKLKANDKECVELLKSIHTFAVSINRLNRLPRTPPDMQYNLNRAQELIARGSTMCLELLRSKKIMRFMSTEGNDKRISLCREQLNRLQSEIGFQLTVALYAGPDETSVSAPKDEHSSTNSQGKSKDPKSYGKGPEQHGQQHEKNGQPDPKTGESDISHGDEKGQGQQPKNDEKDQDQQPKLDDKAQGQQPKKVRPSVQKTQYRLRLHYRKLRQTNKQDPSTTIVGMLDLESKDNDVAVFVWGEEETAKGDFADEVCLLLNGKEWIPVTIETSDSEDCVEGLAGVSLWHWKISEEMPLDGDSNKTQTELSGSLLRLGGKEKLFSIPTTQNLLLILDNVTNANILKRVLRKMRSLKKKIRLLVITDDNRHVISVLGSYNFQKHHYVMQPLSYGDVEKYMNELLNTDEEDKRYLRKIIKICKGYKNKMEIILSIMFRIKDRADFRTLFEWIDKKDRSFEELEKYISCHEKYLDLPEYIREAFLDICSFFNNWEWRKVACILGNDPLKNLEDLDLLKRDASNVNVPGIVKEFGLSLCKGNRINNVAELYTSLFIKQVAKMKGIWLLKNKIPFYLPTEKLNNMCGSLRVLALGDHTIMKGECGETFKELRYFQVGRVPDHPFNMIKLNQPSFIENISGKDMGLVSERVRIPSTLRMVNLKTNIAEDCIKLQRLVPKSCKLVEVDMSGSAVQDLGKEFCELHALERLILNKCDKIARLPERFGKFRLLKVLDVSHCNELTSLPSNFGWLSALEKVNLSFCKQLQELPDSMGLLSSVKEINLSHCKKIEKLPKSFVNLSTLHDLQMKACSRLRELPEGFEKLTLKKLCLESCKRLNALPKVAGQQIFSETTVSISWCLTISEVSIGFLNLIKAKVEHLILADCISLQTLPEEFARELSRLKTLNLSGCRSLHRLPKGLKSLQCLEKLNLSSCVKLDEATIVLRRMKSLTEINLSNCPNLTGTCLKRLSKLKRLQFLDIHESPNLVEEWELITGQNTDWNFTVATRQLGCESPHPRSRQEFSEFTAAKVNKQSPFFSDKWSFAYVSGQPFCPSTLEEGSTVAVLFYHSHDDEELRALGNMLDNLQMTCRKLQVLHVGRSVTALPREFAGRQRICSCDNYEAEVFFQRQLWATESFDENADYLMILSEVLMSDKGKALSFWKGITNDSLNDFKAVPPTEEYFRFKELIEKTQSSNVELVRALLLTKEANFLIKKDGQVGIEDLKEKSIFLLISWLDKFEAEKKTFQNVYEKLKRKMEEKPIEKSNCFEMVWIPIVSHGRGTPGLYANFVQNIAWSSIANPWCLNSSANRFLRMQYSPDKLPFFIAISPKGQIHFENFIPVDDDNDIQALQDYVTMNLLNAK